MKKNKIINIIFSCLLLMLFLSACNKSTEQNTNNEAEKKEFVMPFQQPADVFQSEENAYDKNSIASTILENTPIPNIQREQVDSTKVDVSKYTLKGSHKEMDLECASCHITDDYNDRVKQDTCFTCHESYENLAAITLKKLGYEDNVHAAPHYPKMDCDLCHKIHKPEGNVYCVTCHTQNSMLKLKAP